MNIVIALVLAFHATMPTTNNAGTCRNPVLVAASDSGYVHARVFFAPPPYRWPFFDDSIHCARGDTARFAYMLPDSTAGHSNVRYFNVYVWASRSDSNATIVPRGNYGCARALLAVPR